MKLLFKEKNSTGKIIWKDKQLGVNFDLSCNMTGTISFSLNRVIASEDPSWLIRTYGGQQKYSEKFQLKGNASNKTIESDSLILNSFSFGKAIKAKGICRQLTVKKMQAVKNLINFVPTLRYYLLGFKCFGFLRDDTEIGQITLSGNTEIDNYEEVTGLLEIRGKSNKNIEQWIQICDKKVRLILNIMSLANGRYITWTLKSLFHDRQWVENTFRGPRSAGHARFPVFHYLHLQPAFLLALNNYSEEVNKNTGFDIALEWFLMRSSYTESEFLTLMVALEHFIYIFNKKKKHDRIFKKFSFIKTAILESYDKIAKKTEMKDLQEAIEASKYKILELNRHSFKNSVFKFINEYKIPIAGIDMHIEKLINVRDKIVHRGIYHPENTEENIIFYTGILRELLTRVFLKFLNYNGGYLSFLNGQETTNFPP